MAHVPLFEPPPLQTFKEVFSKEKSGGQQDVSEFTHKLLEWIEEAFSHTLTATGDSKYVRWYIYIRVFQGDSLPLSTYTSTHTHTHTHSPNPMVQLFTGHCQREGTNNGEPFPKRGRLWCPPPPCPSTWPHPCPWLPGGVHVQPRGTSGDMGYSSPTHPCPLSLAVQV